MGKFIKTGKVVIILQGRYAGRKAIVVKTFDEGNKERNFGHCLVAGIDKNPLPVTKSMSKKKILKRCVCVLGIFTHQTAPARFKLLTRVLFLFSLRSRIKPFVKFVNYNHIMPTRYTVSDIDVKSVVNTSIMKDATQRTNARKEVKKLFEERYINRGKNTSGVQYLFHRLRF